MVQNSAKECVVERSPSKRYRALVMGKTISRYTLLAQLGPRGVLCQPHACIAFHAVLEVRKMDGGGKRGNKISHKLGLTVVYRSRNEDTGVRVQQEQTQEPGMGLWSLIQTRHLSWPCPLPPTHTNPQARFLKPQPPQESKFQKLYTSTSASSQIPFQCSCTFLGRSFPLFPCLDPKSGTEIKAWSCKLQVPKGHSASARL